MSALSTSLLSTIIGYVLKTENFSETTPNLPQSIAILAEANTDNQSGLETDGVEVTSARQAGQLYGWGSPVHQIMSILRPISGEGVAGIKTTVYAQAEPGGAVARVLNVSATGTATGNGTHYLRINGRTNINGAFYAINVVTGDSTAEIADKIKDAILNVLGCPFTATATDYEAVATTKWKGLTSQTADIEVDVQGNALGLTYVVAEETAGSGTPDVAAALAQFENTWHTIVLNSYGTHTGTMSALEAFNGKPDPVNPTGRYAGTVMKPFVALTGTVAENPGATFDTHKNELTIAACPAPLSKGMQFEAAANYCLLWARVAQDTPHLDIQDLSLPDMPVPIDGLIGDMSSYLERDAIVKKGCSTAELSSTYRAKDFVTTWHPDGEEPAQFRYVRDLNIDLNIRFAYKLLEAQYVMGKAIAKDGDTVTVAGVIKPKQWKQILFGMADDLGRRGLIADVQFFKDNIVVGISTINPNRFVTTFKYKRTGLARQSDTTATAGFNFGTITI